MVHPASTFIGLSATNDLKPLFELKEKYDDAVAGGGRVQINTIPFHLKQTLAAGSRDQVTRLLYQMKTCSYMVDTAR
jgi:hypothetical protein